MANRCGLIILWFGDEDNSNLALNTQSPSFWEFLRLCFHHPVVVFTEVMNGYGSCTEERCTHVFICILDKWIQVLPHMLFFEDSDAIFCTQASLQFWEQMKSAWPYLVHICLLISPIYPSILECWSSLFVLASATMYCYFLMVPVIVSDFPSLLPKFNPQNIQISFTQGWKISFTQCDLYVFHIQSTTKWRNKWCTARHKARYIDKQSHKWRDHQLDS